MLKKVLIVLGISILYGCSKEPEIHTVHSLSAEVDSIVAQIAASKPLLMTANNLEKQAGKRLSKEQKGLLLTKIKETRSSLAFVTAIIVKVTAIRDSIRLLGERTDGAVKDGISALNARLDDISSKITEFTNVNKKLFKIEVRLTGNGKLRTQ